MKILVIDEEFPYPLDTGQKIRNFNLARYLAVKNQVSYFAYGHHNQDLHEFMTGHNITPFFVNPPNRKKQGIIFYLKLFLNLFSSYPYMVTSHYRRRFQKALNEITNRNSYDIVICGNMVYSMFLRDIQSGVKVISSNNIETEIWRGYEANETNLFKKLYITAQRKKVEYFEKNAFKFVDGATAVTEYDAGKIENFEIDYPVKVIFNGVDLEYFQPLAAEIDKNLLVFTGSMDYMPNQDAAVYFANDIFPLIKQQRPEMKVAFVGRKPPAFVKALESIDGIIITGTVDDVRPYIAKASLYIVPLRIGGGSRLKILEAMAMKKPVVSTSIGAAGLNVTDNENIIISDGEKQFAEAVISTMDNPPLTEKLVENGRKLVEDYYGWEKLGLTMNDYLESLLKKK